MASPQQIAKDKQGYNPKPIPGTCSSCKHCETKLFHNSTYSNYLTSGDTCGIGFFLVTPYATCKLFEFKI